MYELPTNNDILREPSSIILLSFILLHNFFEDFLLGTTSFSRKPFECSAKRAATVNKIERNAHTVLFVRSFVGTDNIL